MSQASAQPSRLAGAAARTPSLKGRALRLLALHQLAGQAGEQGLLRLFEITQGR